ncbi:MAG: DNA topoisomerase-1 [Francisellaceae bacterium]
MLKDADGKLTVSKVDKKQKKRNPQPPFITSTIQQEASRKLGFSTKKTMMVAQQLYEGMDLGSGESMGLISYMRTDSIHLSQDAITDIRDYIVKNYDEDQVPKEPRVFKSKSKNAQEAHEAIRPTLVEKHPDMVKQYLTADQFKLYSLVWKRAVASQMIHAVINTLSIDLTTGNEQHTFRATGSNIHKPGFIALYQESTDDDKKNEGEEGMNIPMLKEGETVDLVEVTPKQHFTEPPPRYSEATLVKSLEEHGIGRPSTYSSIISTLLHREYVELINKRFHPTDVGNVVNKFLTEYFNKYVDYDYTAKLEDKLDSIANGKTKWLPVMEQFWKPFIKLISDIDGNVKRSDVTQEKMDEKCPDCGNELSIRLGRRGKFIGCTTYPECKYTRPLDSNGEVQEKVEPEIVPDRKCPSCESDLVIKVGRYGKFIGCSGYPNCKHIEPLEKPKDTEIECPQCKKANIMEKKSRRGKIFYSCNLYPKCKYSLWYIPIKEACPKCSWPILMFKKTKKFGEQKVCPQEECDHIENLESPEE